MAEEGRRPPPPPFVNPPEPDRPPIPPVPAVPPVGNVAPAGRGRTLGIPSPVVIIVGITAAVAAFFGVRYLLDEDREAPTPEQVAAAFVPVEGYEYVAMPADAMEPLREAFADQPIAEENIEHFDARQLTQAGRPSAVVFILAVDPDSIEGNFEDAYINGFTTTSQVTVQEMELGDTTGYVAETPLGTIAFFFDSDGYVFNVVGRDMSSVQTIARALHTG